MATIERIRLNRMELKLADTDDPVAQKASWDPLKPGGANFKTHTLATRGDVLAVERSGGGLAFTLVFAAIGVLALGAGVAMLVYGNLGGLVMSLVGAIFAGVGGLIVLGEKPLRFDPRRRIYYCGKGYLPGVQPRSRQGPTSTIHALQLLSERLQSSSSSGRSSYLSYELNLVFDDGSRLNVLDHGKEDDVIDAARKLAAALDVPVWQASYG